MPSGVVRYVGPDGRWGFISRDDKGPKVFLHLNEVEKAGFDEIRKGQRWAFDIVEAPDGRLAAVRLETLI